MKLKDGIVLRDVLGQYVLIDCNSSKQEILKLNNTAATILSDLLLGKNEDEIANHVVSDFDINYEAALNDISDLISELRDMGLLQ